MNELRKHKKRRIPKLSVKPEPGTMRYYASYRGIDRKPKRKRFTKDRKESEIAYHRWVVENYDQSARIVANDHDAGKANFDQSLPVIANAYIHQHEKQLVRSDGANRRTIYGKAYP